MASRRARRRRPSRAPRPRGRRPRRRDRPACGPGGSCRCPARRRAAGARRGRRGRRPAPRSAPPARARARAGAARPRRRWSPFRSPAAPACGPRIYSRPGGAATRPVLASRRMAPTPLTVLSPVPLWWSLWIRLTWLAAALTGRLVQHRLRDLQFIHFAHWSLVGRWPADPAVSADRAAPRTLVFLTNFDGSGIQYIDAFVRMVPD